MEIKRNDSHYIRKKIKAQNKEEIMRVILCRELYDDDDDTKKRDVTILNLQHPSISPVFFFFVTEKKKKI